MVGFIADAGLSGSSLGLCSPGASAKCCTSSASTASMAAFRLASNSPWRKEAHALHHVAPLRCAHMPIEPAIGDDLDAVLGQQQGRSARRCCARCPTRAACRTSPAHAHAEAPRQVGQRQAGLGADAISPLVRFSLAATRASMRASSASSSVREVARRASGFEDAQKRFITSLPTRCRRRNHAAAGAEPPPSPPPQLPPPEPPLKMIGGPPLRAARDVARRRADAQHQHDDECDEAAPAATARSALSHQPMPPAAPGGPASPACGRGCQ